MSKRYSRKNTNFPISIFYEQFQLNKYNFDPPYQRDKNVWDMSQKAFLIDTIMKNFPIPPIFLEQKIDTSNGRTTFDVIDGKQRLNAIVDFINNEITLPDTFGNDDYGNRLMNNKTFEELKEISKTDEDIKNYISDFWSYVINVEYIEYPDSKVVDNIFDRLNRGGERLNPQELRKANFYDTIMYKNIEELRSDEYLLDLLGNLNKNRLEDANFITELYLMIKIGHIIEGFDAQIDRYFKDIVDEIDQETSDLIMVEFNAIKEIVKLFNLDYETYRIKGVSHLYAIWYLAYFLYKKKIPVTEAMIKLIHEFYTDLRNERLNENTIEYHKSMQSASKSKSSRKKRITSLLKYFTIEFSDTEL